MRTSQNTNQNKKIFSKYMQEKLAITVLVITLALFSLVVVLYNIIKENKDTYTQAVLSQQEYDSRVIPYRRGDIVDRNGTYLATSDKVYNLIIDPKQIMSDEEKYFEATVAALCSFFGYEQGEIQDLIRNNSEKAYIRYARQLSIEDKDGFESLKNDTNTANSKSRSEVRIKGVWFEDEYKRIYPYNSLACTILGFARSDGTEGTGGLEQFYNSTLTGTNGREYGYLNDESNLERVIKPAVNGNTIVSSIDTNIQNIVEKHIKAWQTETGSENIAVVVMNPNNGEVLAMANDRIFDLNDPKNISAYYTPEEIKAMDSKAEAEAWNKMWRNYCVSDTYEPGSPTKIFTIAAALEEGLISEQDTYFCDGFQQVGIHKISCSKNTGHGMLTLEESLMVSCNDAMMQIAAKTGREYFSKYQKLFGFGSKTRIDLPGEADTKSLLYDGEKMGPSDLATNSFGQNFNCTMIQMAAAYCSAINGGSYYEPHLVKQVLNSQGSVIKKVEPNLVRETVSEGTANFLKKALLRTVSEGTGRAAAVVGYEVGGKTGTAEKVGRNKKDYLVSFAGYAPAMNPEVFVYVIIDQPHVESQPHSSYASGVFQKIMAEILPYMNIFPTLDLPEEEGVEEQLPSEEGITDNSGTVLPEEETKEETVEEKRTYAADEYIEPEITEEGTDVPESGAEETSEAEPEESSEQ